MVKFGVTYILTHPGFRAVKVGYTTTKSTRLEDFGRQGWQPYRTLVVATHELARQVEQAVLFEIRFRLYVPAYLMQADMRWGGWSETSSLGLIAAHEVWGIVCEQAGLIQLGPTVTRAPDGRRNNGGTPPARRPGQTQPYSRLARKQARLEQMSMTAVRGDAN
ncbi:hypothetical protein [Streptomyces antimycoticus]|uniref:hypothetical protein n=1 Tax=Streptomyces antimycoticus TaxID=68175 RepID=UPI0038641AEC|nr:GIY-YIG nuclease family protein [Streptomyces antimycoticus]